MTNEEMTAFKSLKSELDSLNADLATTKERVVQLTGYLTQLTTGIDPGRKASFEIVTGAAASARSAVKGIVDEVNKVLPAS